MFLHGNTIEAAALRARRRKARQAQPVDALAERARLVALWRLSAKSNPAYRPCRGCWWHPFLTQPAFRRLLMPALRAMLDARDRERRERYAAELRESGRKWEQKKAERSAAKARAKLPQRDLLDDAEGAR